MAVFLAGELVVHPIFQGLSTHIFTSDIGWVVEEWQVCEVGIPLFLAGQAGKFCKNDKWGDGSPCHGGLTAPFSRLHFETVLKWR